MTVNPLRQLNEHGQSVWLDNLSRTLITSGDLRRLIEGDGISGITSNPAIFKAAIVGSNAYDDQIRDLSPRGMETIALYEALAIDDIRAAADLLHPVFDAANGTDGFVSLEVNPHLARDTRGTVAEAERLWLTVDRENVFIKIPGTPQGMPAIEEALYRGINVNVTLLFSLGAYKDVMLAHQKALARRQVDGLPLATVASVASFFLSRIDSMVDKRLDAITGANAAEAKALRGATAVASAKAAYRMWQETYGGRQWEKLAEAGARVQKPLWASTSTKDPAYPDTKYVEPLVGEQTVNTMPDATIEAFRDHGKVIPGSVEQLVDEAKRVPIRLAKLGVNLSQVTDALVEEGIAKFNEPFDALLKSLEEKRAALAAG